METKESPCFFFAHPEASRKGKSLQDAGFSVAETTFYEDLSGATTLKHVYIFGNHSTYSPSAHKHAAANASKGFAAGFSTNTLLKHLVGKDGKGLLFSSRWFGQSLVVKVPASAVPPQFSDETARAVVFDLQRALDANRDDPERANKAAVLIQEAGNLPGGRDAVSWKAACDGHGHFVGVYRKIRSLADEGPSEYYLAVHTDAGAVGDALNKFALENKDTMTLGQFVQSSEYITAADLSERNARRLMALLATRLGFTARTRPGVHASSLIALEVDNRAALEHGGDAPPDLYSGTPFAHSVYNMLRRPAPSSDAVIYYGGVTHLSNDSNRVVYLKSAATGISIFPLSADRDYRYPKHNIIVSGKPSAGQSESTLVVTEPNPYAAFPIGSGRYADRKRGLAALNAYNVAAIKQGYSWPGRVAQEDLKNFGVGSVPRALYSYSDLTSDTEHILNFMLGGPSKRIDLEFVAVALSDNTK